MLCRYGVDTVAAETHVQDSFETPLDFVKVNVEGTVLVALLNECLSYGKLKSFIYISTDEVYGDSSEGTCRPKTEQDELAPTNPYAASKASAEHFVNVFHKSYNFPAVTVRMCNAYDPMQSRDKLIQVYSARRRGKTFYPSRRRKTKAFVSLRHRYLLCFLQGNTVRNSRTSVQHWYIFRDSRKMYQCC